MIEASNLKARELVIKCLINQKLPKETRTAKEDSIKKSQQQIAELNKKLEFNKQLKSVYEKELTSKNSSSSVSSKKTINLKPIQDACVKKYNFDPNQSTPPEVLNDIEIIDFNEFKNSYKDVPVKLIEIDDVYSILHNGKSERVKVTGVDVDNDRASIVGVENTSINGTIKCEYLRSKSFPNYNEIKNKILKYLSKNADSYSNMSEEDQKKIEKVYMSYKYIENLVKKRTLEFGVSESLEYDDYYLITEADDAAIKEEPVINQEKTSSNVVPTGSGVKTKPDEARAGQKATTIPLMKATVKDILTRRDRDKYKDKSEQFTIKVNEINLAEIEKTIENIERSGTTTVKTDVSKMVNPYNLRVIQLTIDKLMIPKESKDGVATAVSDPNLKIKWKKKLDGTYAAFYKIMDTKYINDILEKASLSDIDDTLSNKLNKSFNNINEQTNALNVASHLPAQSKEAVNIGTIKTNGYWCYYNFLYDKKSYNSIITPVSVLFSQGAPLIQLTSFFDLKDGTVKIADKKAEDFISDSLDITVPKTKTSTDVYFLLKSNQSFPVSTVQKFKVFVLNEVTFSDNTKQLFVLVNKNKRITGEKVCVPITDDFMNKINGTSGVNSNKDKYIHEIDSVYFARFNDKDFPKSKDSLGVKNNGFSLTVKPDTMKDDAVVEKLKELSSKLS